MGVRSTFIKSTGVSVLALTDTEIQRSKPTDKAYRIFDSGGLHFFITPASGRFWRWKYRVSGPKSLMTLGKYPKISFAHARERHASARKQLANGFDPMAERMAARTAVKVANEHTFEKIAGLWLENWHRNMSLRHAAIDENRLKTKVYPVLYDRPNHRDRVDGACPTCQRD